ncbi:class I SAM-dependent methyltransferase [bacterium]|nr:class I SAM-dependent methyltransferase [bacterium]
MKNFFYLAALLLKRSPRFLFVYFKDAIWFDLANGTSTHLRVPKKEAENQTLEQREGLLYVASFTSVITETLKISENSLGTKEFLRRQFIDLGCGKGKALLLYNKLFGKTAEFECVGIEYEESLCKVAKSNIAKCLGSISEVKVFCDTALNLGEYVNSGSLIVYLYNSFQGQTLRDTLKILSDYEHILIYVDPVEKELIEASGYTVVKNRSGRYNANTWVVYTYNRRIKNG